MNWIGRLWRSRVSFTSSATQALVNATAAATEALLASSSAVTQRLVNVTTSQTQLLVNATALQQAELLSTSSAGTQALVNRSISDLQAHHTAILNRMANHDNRLDTVYNVLVEQFNVTQGQIGDTSTSISLSINETTIDLATANTLLTTRSGEQVKVALADYKLSNASVLVARDDLNTSANATTSIGVQNPVRSAQFRGVALDYSPLLSTEVLMEMNYLTITAGDNETASEVLLKVEGVARIPDFGAPWGSVVKVVTRVGTISIYDATDIRFSNLTSNLFEEMGLATAPVGPGRRRLAQSASSRQAVQGLFNHVGSQSYMDASLWDFSAVAANRDAVRAKAGNGRGVVDRAAQGKAGDESTLMANWAAWKRQYDTRAVGTARAKAERLRYATFKKNLARILAHNSNPTAKWVATGTRFMDADFPEVAAVHKLTENQQYLTDALADSRNDKDRNDTYSPGSGSSGRRLLQTATAPSWINAAIRPPTTVNWVEAGAVTPVVEQGRMLL